MAFILDYGSARFYLFCYLQVTPICPNKFRVNWLSVQEKKSKKDFNRNNHGRPPSISTLNNFSYFISTCHHDASYQVSIGLSVQEKKRKIDFQDGDHGGQAYRRTDNRQSHKQIKYTKRTTTG